jgi:hypothetical protein
MTRTAMKRAPVTAVLTDRPSMLRPTKGRGAQLNQRPIIAWSCGG